ncbi:MAG TPA: cytochrome c [Bacteroidales bacterium]|nr:cytochrome c [Bacteroidales bacterium]
MSKIFSFVCISFLLSAILSCGGGSDEGKKNRTETTNQKPAEAEAGSPKPGQDEYSKYCLTCHQQDGNGVRGQFPPLAGNEVITGPADSLIRIVLFGLEGPITVKGLEYNQLMPAQDYLTDQQIADVLTYIRSSWGNNAEAVKPENVAPIRKAGKSR